MILCTELSCDVIGNNPSHFYTRMAADSATAKATFETANSIRAVSSVDQVFHYDHSKQQELLAAKPWERELVGD